MVSRELRNALIKRCTDPISAFACLGKTIETRDGPLTHIDRGANVLCVAHLDFVEWTDYPHLTRSGKMIRAGQLDDRLGAWCALDLLPALGVVTDVLLTDSEEVGRSTAQHYIADKEYNWLVQFDRSGTDVVMYDYDCASNRQILSKFDFPIGHGSFTDICWLDHLEVSGFNIGTGYYRQHTKNCHAYIRETLTNAKRFRRMWQEYKDVKIPAPEKTSGKGYRRGYSTYAWNDDYDYYGSYSARKTPSCDGYPQSIPVYDYDYTDDDTILDASPEDREGMYLSEEYDKYVLSELLRSDDLEYQCPGCMGWNNSPVSCSYCGARYYECKGCGEVLTNWDWDCGHCGTVRSDMTELAYLAQFK